MDRHRALAASRDEVQRLAGQSISEVAPSRRDFAQYVVTQRQGLAVIATLSHLTGGATSRPQLAEQARACDDAEVAALALATTPGPFTPADLAVIADATTAPLLREDLLIHASQLYVTRLHGGDAAVFPAADLDETTLRKLVTVASSLHMASVIEATTERDVQMAARLPHVLVGVRCVGDDGKTDVGWTIALAQQVPMRCPVINLVPVHSVVEAASLRGHCDAVVIDAAPLSEADLAAVVRELGTV